MSAFQGDLLSGRWTAPRPPQKREPKERGLMPLLERIAHHEATAANLHSIADAYRVDSPSGIRQRDAYRQAAESCERHLAGLRAERDGVTP